jgi:hypothetical protein
VSKKLGRGEGFSPTVVNKPGCFFFNGPIKS